MMLIIFHVRVSPVKLSFLAYLVSLLKFESQLAIGTHEHASYDHESIDGSKDIVIDIML